MEHDPGRTAMWICSALVGLLRAKGIIIDEELASLADALERGSGEETGEERADMLRASQWMRHSIPAAND